MSEETKDQCKDPTENFTVELPCRLIERMERYARENNTTVTGLVIEALDSFLRKEGRM